MFAHKLVPLTFMSTSHTPLGKTPIFPRRYKSHNAELRFDSFFSHKDRFERQDGRQRHDRHPSLQTEVDRLVPTSKNLISFAMRNKLGCFCLYQACVNICW
jgi:hypothetical protein